MPTGTHPGGFLEIDGDFNVAGRWEASLEGMNFNYDFWYQPRHNVMVSSEWAAPNTVKQGFHLEDVQKGKYGHQLHFWDWKERRIDQSIDLGESGLIPLEVRFHHNPDSTHGFVGAALSSAIFHWYRKEDQWVADKVIQVDPVETAGWPFPVPGLITDLVLSLDDRYLYFSDWLHGDIRQYDVSDPSHPKLVGQIWLGGVIGHKPDWNGGRQSGRWAPNAAAQSRRQTTLRDQFAVQRLGQSVLSDDGRTGIVDAEDRLRHRKRGFVVGSAVPCRLRQGSLWAGPSP